MIEWRRESPEPPECAQELHGEAKTEVRQRREAPGRAGQRGAGPGGAALGWAQYRWRAREDVRNSSCPRPSLLAMSEDPVLCMRYGTVSWITTGGTFSITGIHKK